MKIVKLACLLAFCTLLTACGGSSVQSADSLSIVTMFAGDDASASSYQSLLSGFSSQTGIKVVDNSEVATQEWKTQVTNTFESGDNIPDVIFYFTGSEATSMILDNQFVSIEEIQVQYPNFATNIRSSTMEFMREFDNKHYAVPVKGFWEGLFCNTDLFEAYNLELPTDWENFQKAITTFNEAGVTPISVSMNEVPHYWIEHLVLSAGGASVHKLNPYMYIPDSWVEGFTQMVNIYELGGFSHNCLENSNVDAVNAFVNKESAMLIEGSWSLSSVLDNSTTVVLPIPSCDVEYITEEIVIEIDEETGLEYEVITEIPHYTQNTSIVSGFSSGFYITRQAWDDESKRDSVVELVTYLTSDSAIASLCANGGAPAADVQIAGSNSLLDMSVLDLQGNAQEALMPVDSTINTQAWTHLVSSVPLMLQGEITPLEVITIMSELNTW